MSHSKNIHKSNMTKSYIILKKGGDNSIHSKTIKSKSAKNVHKSIKSKSAKNVSIKNPTLKQQRDIREYMFPFMQKYKTASIETPYDVNDAENEMSLSINSIPGPTKTLVTQSKKTIKSPAKVISRFMRRTTPKRRSVFLQIVCSDSGVCISLGTNRQKIIDFFDGFTGFHYVKPPIKSVGSISANGFVKEIQYEKNGYIAHAILKSSITPYTDNLVYEYMVGLYINDLCKYVPCFIESYGLFYYKDENAWNQSKSNTIIKTNELINWLEPVNNKDIYNYEKICKQSKHAAILIQHIKDAKSLHHYLTYNPNTLNYFYLHHLIYILYQIYMPLTMLVNNFTHYDLHVNNILLYEPIPGKYLHFHYHLDDDVIEFKSQYIAKIIDYGRSFFNYPYEMHEKINPSTIYEKICSEPNCETIIKNKKLQCGQANGFNYFNKNLQQKHMYILSTESNPSHDLRLLYSIKDFMNERNISFTNSNEQTAIMQIMKLLNKVKYGDGINEYHLKSYGTIPNTTDGLPYRINNVINAEQYIGGIILQSSYFKTMNDEMYSDPNKKIGDIHVYNDGELMEFIPYKQP